MVVFHVSTFILQLYLMSGFSLLCIGFGCGLLHSAAVCGIGQKDTDQFIAAASGFGGNGITDAITRMDDMNFGEAKTILQQAQWISSVPVLAFCMCVS